MKKIASLILVITGMTTSILHAQDFYLKAGTGYAFAMPGQTKDQLGNVLNGTVTNASTSYAGFDVRNASFSSGVHGIVGGGYMFTKNIGLEVNIDLNVAPHKYTQAETALENSSSQYYDYTSLRQAKTTMLFIPALVLQTANKTRCNLYMRMGIALPVNGGIKMHESYHYYQTGDLNEYNWDIKNYFSLGFTAATGVKVKIGHNVSLWAETSILYLALSREERDLETATFNGVSYPPSRLNGVTSYHYSKSGVTNTIGTEQSFSQPFSNFAVLAGISYTVDKPKSKAPKKQTN